MKFSLSGFRLGISTLILVVAAYFTLFLNWSFFRNSYQLFAAENGGLTFLASLTVLLFAVTVLLLSLMCFRWLTKPVLITLVLTAAMANYYMVRFNIMIDSNMLTNIRETDMREVRDLINADMLLQLLVLGIIPALLIMKSTIRCQRFSREIFQRLKLIAFSLVLALCSILPFTAYYSSFFREHKALRYYTNPVTTVYSVGRYIADAISVHAPGAIKAIGLDAHIPPSDQDRELIILVVGEAVRSDHLGLNGYQRDTTPLLAKAGVTSFSNIYSCGTATAWSVPCMFSQHQRDDFELDEAGYQENLLDVLQHAGVNVLWRDNNSDSKGVAKAEYYEDFTSSSQNPVCDTECRDIGMLAGLEDYIAAHDSGDIVIVLHQMGNHGPAYYRRFPPEFAAFQPYCQSNRLETCSDQEIVNAYDNAVLYTDYFLNEVIRFLKNYDGNFETAMLYMSDHGESLGENGIYLHGLPYYFAPENQKHVASMLWLGNHFQADRAAVQFNAAQHLSHDNFFHTVLGLMEIQTSVYQPALDILRKHQSVSMN